MICARLERLRERDEAAHGHFFARIRVTFAAMDARSRPEISDDAIHGHLHAVRPPNRNVHGHSLTFGNL